MTSSMPGGPLLAADNLTKTYGSTAALAGISLAVYPGEAVAVMGASGSGKTTLLHCLAGIIRPDTGSVRLFRSGAPVEVTALDDDARSALRRSDFGFVFQQGLLIPELTAGENVALALMLNGAPRAEAEQAAVQALAALGLAGMEQRRIGELSGGQAQRVAIARAQVNGARVLFADEPTGALDSHTSAEVMGLLLRTVEGTGRSLVVVTHDPSVARWCGRVITVADGRIVADTAGAGRTR
ncbi:ABC transporter ATP-binding protein [Arthrobacter zhangbolii]|uniref:ABC transporter ATP-binding protein n=1 Tax=Arthrobacter zhangbolii TaxID=2886936 RepID=A0A9X1SCH7_9MICC|nr:ABC transporter ATP-binding protein [Arthrobacter zhangbolii]MCC3273914.1 ABC transporter ATP-binding protein [Arthrobacter zhangbolii]UON91098.1 ABC transporter ATP-binding protein [Arthrobacter zhangbolii]